jgi:hypothetical protein
MKKFIKSSDNKMFGNCSMIYRASFELSKYHHFLSQNTLFTNAMEENIEFDFKISNEVLDLFHIQ